MSISIVKQINFTQDAEAYLEIWEQCFPHEREFANRFLATVGDQTGLAVFEDGTPVSMAFFLPSVLHLPPTAFSARYVYAVSTLPTHRGKGYATRLLSVGIDRFPADLFYLHPQASSLEAFYARQGYDGCLFTDRLSLSEKEWDTVSFVEMPFGPADYLAGRTACFSEGKAAFNAFSPSLLSLMTEELSLIKCADGWAVVGKDEQCCRLLETTVPPAKIPAVLSALKRQNPQKRISACFPGKTEMIGMVLPLSKAAKAAFSEVTLPFSGLWFDM